MATRCIACNSRLSNFDFSSKKPDNPQEYEDLCSTCRNAVYSAEYHYEHDYQHQYLTEDLLNCIHYDK